MTGIRANLSATARVPIVLCIGLALAACDENGDFSFPTLGDTVEAGPAVGGQITELVERDVEAPEVFQKSEQGLWDGRPSLGGVWVAHPDVTDPERVIIRNEANGSFVIGALFRRERDNPGPALQVSSDAAAALDMLAGAPAMLNVTALRREEAAVPVSTPETSPAVDPATATLEAPVDIAATPLDPVAQPAAAPAAPSAAPSAPAPAAGGSTLDRPYIQIGIFSIEANAENTAIAMRTAGLTAQVVRQESQGSMFWRVIVGPATTEAERSRNLDLVKARGFADAYFVRN